MEISSNDVVCGIANEGRKEGRKVVASSSSSLFVRLFVRSFVRLCRQTGTTTTNHHSLDDDDDDDDDSEVVPPTRSSCWTTEEQCVDAGVASRTPLQQRKNGYGHARISRRPTVSLANPMRHGCNVSGSAWPKLPMQTQRCH